MGKRRKSRELALQMLYAKELSGDPGDVVLSKIHYTMKKEGLEEDEDDSEIMKYAEQLFNWVLQLLPGLDKELDEIISNWKLDRLSRVDINLIRLGCAEMKKGGLSLNIVADEIVELAKRFSDEGSPDFVNGVLDSWAKKYKRAE
jgi:transcription antitermination protein NusB